MRATLLITAVVAFSAVAQNAGPEKQFKFEVLSLKPTGRGPSVGVSAPTPNGFSAKALLYQVVLFAYGPPCPISQPNCAPTEIRNLPNWSGDVYAFDARVSQADLTAWQNQGKNYDLLRAALRAALTERCKLVLHKEPKQQPMMELVIAKGGPRLKAADPGATLPIGVKLEGGGVTTGINQGRAGWNFYGASMLDLAYFLNIVCPGAPVRDRTGLTGRYDFTLRRDPNAPMTYHPEMQDDLYLEELQLRPNPAQKTANSGHRSRGKAHSKLIGRRFSMKATLPLTFLLLSAGWLRAQVRLTETLNKAILEEESQHNLPAAVADYQQVVAAFDEERHTAAAALFRLAECQRKLHRRRSGEGRLRAHRAGVRE